jgi:hypothetical protein
MHEEGTTCSTWFYQDAIPVKFYKILPSTGWEVARARVDGIRADAAGGAEGHGRSRNYFTA